MGKKLRQGQRITGKPSFAIVSGSVFGLACCSALLWFYLGQRPTETEAATKKLPEPQLEFELPQYETVDQTQLRILNYKLAKPLMQDTASSKRKAKEVNREE